MAKSIIAARIRAMRKRRMQLSWSIRRLGKEAGINGQTLSGMDDDDCWNPTLRVLIAVEDALFRKRK